MERKRSMNPDRPNINRHIDTTGPKKELEKAERQLELIKRETTKSFEREKRQMEIKIEKTGRKISQYDQAVPAHKDSTASEKYRRASVASTSSMPMDNSSQYSASASQVDPSAYRARKISGAVKDQSPLLDHPQLPQLTTAEKQVDALKQLRYLHDVVISMIKEAQIQVSVQDKDMHMDMRRNKTSVSWREQTTEEEMKTSRKPSSTADPGGTTDRKRKISRGLSYNVDNDPALYSRRKATMDYEDTQWGHSGVSTPGTDDFMGAPSQAVELISIARMLCIGRNLETKQIKALTSVLEESRASVKAIKGGMDLDRAQERLIKRLNELLDQVKPLGTDLLITPAEILRCSYLRLSPENVQTMEQMMIEQGLNPGIHSHSKVENMTLQELREMEAGIPHAALAKQSNCESPASSFQPVTIYQTKAGTPMDKRRISRPESMSMRDDDMK